MKRFILLIFSVVSCLSAFAQDDFVGPLNSNAQLHHFQKNIKSSFFYKNVLIKADTLSLPFLDDFSTPTLKSYDFDATQIYDTLKNVVGTCISEGDFTTSTKALMFDTSYQYSYNLSLLQVDSTPKAAIFYQEFNSSSCFEGTSLSAYYFPSYYTYTFESGSGIILDSTLVAVDTLIESADIYLANLDPASLWVDNYAYWNSTFPKNPPSIGVATLDGLNEFGLPYNVTVINPIGQADYLTSKPIDLSGLTNDSAVFISFFVQARGFGDAPNSPDSLILEFKNEYENIWTKAWSISIDQFFLDEFKQFYVAVRDTNLVAGPRYFYEDFQFRFRNIASLSGNNDHWNIDYVRLDKNRALIEQDTLIRDVAFMYDFPNVLETYTMLPWSQFQAGADNFASSLAIPIRDNGQVNGVSAGAFPLEIYITDSLDTDTIFQLSGQNFNPTQEIKDQVFQPISDFVKPNFEGDSICINASMKMLPTARNLLTTNDSIYKSICFDKVMAYDDGSAERAYGIGGSTNEVKKFAYEFEVAHPDTLAGLQIHFSNIDQDVSNLVFSFYVWDSIEVDQPLSYEHVIATIDNQKPVYINEMNGFATFTFDTPILVTNKFYIGWVQTDTRNLQVGYDKNSTKGHDHMYLYTSSTWRKSIVADLGSPMLRAILDANFDFPSSISSVIRKENTLKVYPNPTRGLFTIDLPSNQKNFLINIYDYTGKLVIQENSSNTIDLSSFTDGVYLIQTNLNGNLFYSKVVKQ